jgi:hypothetical protein
MSLKNDDITGRQGRYDLPAGTYEIIETDVMGAAPGNGPGTSIGRRIVSTYRPAYLGEDDTVLACCHHAHEVAKAHGAREVMLEHLVHALVRVPESAQVLNDRGINVESLKRESAAVISSEIPVDHTMMITQLRASKDFNTVMHLAAAAASRRDERMLGARDLLDALLRFDPKSRVVRMLRRHAQEGELEEPVDPLAEVKGMLERYASEQRDLRLAVNELRSAQVGQTSTAVASLEDRLRGIERSLNGLVTDAAAERVAMGDRLKLFHDTLSAHRNDTRASLDRIQGIERLVSSSGSGGMGSAVHDRILMVQKSLDGHRQDVARIELLVSERLKAIDGQPGGDLSSALSERLAKIEAKLEARTPDGKPMLLSAGLEAVGDRMQSLERQVSAQRADLQGWQGAIEKDVKALEDIIDLIPAGGGSGAPMSDAQALSVQKALEAGRAEGMERHRAIERLLEVKLAGVAGLNGVSERFVNLERALAAQRSDQAAVKSALDTELEQIRKAMLSLGNAQQTLTTAIDEWRQNNSGDLSVISNRIGGLERSMGGFPANGATVGVTSAPQQPVPMQGTATPQATAVQSAAPSALQSGGLLDKVDRVLSGRYNSN